MFKCQQERESEDGKARMQKKNEGSSVASDRTEGTSAIAATGEEEEASYRFISLAKGEGRVLLLGFFISLKWKLRLNAK